MGGYPGTIQLEENEKVKNIKHYFNGWNMGKRIKFTTNIRTIIVAGDNGRGVEQKKVTSEFNVSPGKDLVGLIFDNGKLVGIEEN